MGRPLRARFRANAGHDHRRVKDSSGAVLPGATVTVVNKATNATRTTSSNEVGLFDFPALPPGTYTVKSELDGFRSATPRRRTAGAADRARRLRAGVGHGLRKGDRDRRVAAGRNVECDRRHRHREPAHRRAAAQRQKLSPARRVEPERQRRVCGPGSGGRPPGRHARQPAAVDFRTAPRIQLLHAGRRRQHRRQLQHLHLPAVGRRARRVQSADRRLLRRVRARGEPGERGHEIGLEQSARHAVRIPPRRRAGRQTVPFTAAQAAAKKAPFKWDQYGYTAGGPVFKNRLFFMSNFEGYRDRKQFQNPFSVPSTAMRNGDFSELLASLGRRQPTDRTTEPG